MFLQKKNFSVVCTDCNVTAKTLRQHEEDINRGNPEWFWEPWDNEEYHLFVCPKCLKKDFISDSEIDF